jgi:hypothetical protein
MDWNKIRHDPLHLGVPSGAPKTFSEPTVHSAQTVHLSCVKICTIYRQTEMSFHLSLVTKEHLRVRPKQFLSLWYVWRKPCTYLALTLTPYLNAPKWDSTRPTSPRSSIVCVQKITEPKVHSAQIVHLSCVKINTISKRTKMSFQLSLVILE